MSIAEMIMQGGNQQSKNWSVLSENLGRLGKQVTDQLVDTQYQKQAAQMLPIIQEQMRNSLNLAGSGKPAESYSALIPLLTDPSIQQNRYLLPSLQVALDSVGKVNDLNYKQSLINAQYGPRTNDGYSDEDEAWATGGIVRDGTGGAGDVEKQPPNQPKGFLLDGDLPTNGGFLGFEASLTDRGQNEKTFEMAMSAFTDNLKEQGDGLEQLEAIRGIGLTEEELNQNKEKATAATAPRGYKEFSFGESGLLTVPGITALAGPEVYQETQIKRELEETRTAGGREGRKVSGKTKETAEQVEKNTVESKDFNTFKDALIAADAVVASNPRAFNALKQSDFNYNRIGIQATAPDDPNSSYELYIDGTLIPDSEVSKTVAGSIEFMKGASNKASSSNYKFIKPAKPAAAAQPAAAGGLPAVQAQAPAPAAPEIPDVEGNPFAEKVKKIKTKETEEQKKVTTDEISRVVETTSRLQQALEGLAKGEYPKVMDYLPRAKKTALESSSVDALRSEYNVLASVKPAIEWLKNNPNHKDAARAAEVIRKKLGI